ncbi:MAG: AAA family ATPase, partial [Ilumatobacteraceae bacterium]|nr:AAA family ATPase [Ilumatobacteraceae bacterium]
MDDSLLSDATSSFLSAVSEQLAALSGQPAGTYVADVANEASNIVGGVISADDRITEGEFDAYLDAIGPLMDPPLAVSTQAARELQLFKGMTARLSTPSVLFDLLARADAQRGSQRSHVYYERAMRLAHVGAALDLVPSSSELTVIDGFRTALLRHLDSLGVPRPGQPPPRPAPATPTASPTTSAPAMPPSSNVEKAATAIPTRSMIDLLAELDQLVGLANVKAEVRRLSSLLQVQQLRAERGMPTIETSHHLVFTGNPGTGKTTVARLLSQIFHAVGVVTEGHLVETDRSKLVAGFVGQTALKTQTALESALGGMLLVDEAYALARGGENDFGLEAIDTLVKFMEDHRDDIAIVAAGYPAEMTDFINSNPGLKSRFTRTISFPDYTEDELVDIFLQLGEKNQYHLSDDALRRVRHFIAAEPRTRGFVNAPYLPNLFETADAHQAVRLAPLTEPSDEQL